MTTRVKNPLSPVILLALLAGCSGGAGTGGTDTAAKTAFTFAADPNGTVVAFKGALLEGQREPYWNVRVRSGTYDPVNDQLTLGGSGNFTSSGGIQRKGDFVDNSGTYPQYVATARGFPDLTSPTAYQYVRGIEYIYGAPNNQTTERGFVGIAAATPTTGSANYTISAEGYLRTVSGTTGTGYTFSGSGLLGVDFAAGTGAMTLNVQGSGITKSLPITAIEVPNFTLSPGADNMGSYTVTARNGVTPFDFGGPVGGPVVAAQAVAYFYGQDATANYPDEVAGVAKRVGALGSMSVYFIGD